MSVIRFVALPAIALSLSLSGCRDGRREVVRSYLQAHPPKDFEVVTVPGDFTMAGAANGTSETVVSMRYRLTRSTVEKHGLLSLPRGSELAERIAAVRGWALSSLPAKDSTRESIISSSGAALAAFPTKRIVTPKGTEIESPVLVTLSKEADGWKVQPSSPLATAPGFPDEYPRVPLEDSPEVAAKLADLEMVARRLENLRQTYLADRQRNAARSLAKMRALLKTGNTFEGHLPDHTPVRLIVSRGADAGESMAVVVTIQRTDHSSARYTGGITQQPSGEAVWRAAQVTSLSGPSREALTDANFHPILTLTMAGDHLVAEVKTTSSQTISFQLDPAESADLIPDVSSQDTENKGHTP